VYLLQGKRVLIAR